MERPISAASSATTSSRTHLPAQQHRRHASSIKSGLRPAGTSTVSLFVTNLRLLEFDLYQDWPNITTLSFLNYDARTRIKHSEYALYQLFRIYDPATAAEKLQPFFPPLEPLQSVNLRAALFRCLNELKKGGVLPRDTVLRKTMLDDCQGDKFWEVCLGFSAVVLKKRMAEKKRTSRSKRTSTPAAAEQIGTAKNVSKSQRESMLPLAIAHRAALSRVLEQKQEKKQVYGRLYDVLVCKEAELVQRKAKAHEQPQGSRQTKPERLQAVEETVQRNWIGSTELRDALVEGDTCPKGDGLLVKSFDHLWNGDEGNGGEAAGADVGLLQTLTDRTTEQSARLRKWQHFYDRLTASKPQSARSSRPVSQVQKTGLTFSKHRDINLTDSQDDNDRTRQQQRTHTRNDTLTRYDDILTAMREELRKNSTAHRKPRPSASPIQQHFNVPKRSQTQPIAPMRKLSVAIGTSAGAQSPHVRSPSGTTVPLRSPMGRRVSSRSRSYDRPKIEGMREPIPLKTELFSPLKGSRRSSLSPLSANAVLAPTVEAAEMDEVDEEDEGSVVPAEETTSTETEPEPEPVKNVLKSPVSPRDSGLGLKADEAVRSVSFRSESNSTDSSSASDAEPTVSVRPAERANGHMSLAERTRMSMAFSSPDKAPASPERISDLPEHSLTSDDVGDARTMDTLPVEQFDRRTSLLDRTRQSISQAPKPKKSSHHRSRTSTYPINQFEMPKKVRRSTIGRDEIGGRRDVTPMEKLMSPEAQYDSVFKSRPKIALSPVLSPSREGMDPMDSPPAVSVGAED